MKIKENVSDSDSNSSSSWIILNKEPETVREEVEDVELSEQNSDIESESDGISVISESDAQHEEKCMETYDNIIDYRRFNDYKCNKIVCTKTSQCDFDNLGFWGAIGCILCGCLCAFVTMQGHLYLKQTEHEIKTMAEVVDSAVGCVDAFKNYEINLNKSNLKECVVSIMHNVRYGESVERAIRRRFNINKSNTIPLDVEIEEDLGEKLKNPVKKNKCKKKKPIKNNLNIKDKETNNMKATCKLKAKKGNFKKNKNKELLTGEWYLDLHKARNEIRSREHDSDWFFDRATIRNKKRNSALWYFSYMKMREKYRFKSSKKENS